MKAMKTYLPAAVLPMTRIRGSSGCGSGMTFIRRLRPGDSALTCLRIPHHPGRRSAVMADSFKSKRVGQPGEDALPSDMSTVSLIGGGLIAGDALAALGLGLVGLAATLLG